VKSSANAVRDPWERWKTASGNAETSPMMPSSVATGTAPKAAARFHWPSATCATMGDSAKPAPATA